MYVTNGLFDHMVLQRNRRNESDALVEGKCRTNGPVTVRVRRRKQTFRGFGSARAGHAKGGCFKARLKGIPAGGPYVIELNVGDETVIAKDVLIGDVWIVGGQSNMQGCGERCAAIKPHRMVRAFYMDDRWDAAADPIHNLWNAVDAFHGGSPGGKDDGGGGVGPGVAFGQTMYKRTGVPQGLIACAHGGTSMAQWDPALKRTGGKSLYGATIRRFRKNGSKVAGVIWYQGESDADGTVSPLYTERMKKLVASMRRDMGDARLPFVGVQLSRYVGEMPWHGWNSIQEQQRRLSDCINRCLFVPAIDLGLVDAIHINAESQAILGTRLAEAMIFIREGRRAARPPITLKGISLRAGHKGLSEIVVAFDNVAGSLRASVRPMGFDVIDQNGPTLAIHNAYVEDNKIVLSSAQPNIYFSDKFLHYGCGLHPPCNVADDAGWPLPVFGPLRITAARATTQFVRNIRGSKLVSAGKIRTVPCPARKSGQDWNTIRSEFDFINVNSEFVASPKGTTKYFRYDIRCPEAMRLALLLGYDGPVKVWIDGKVRHVDPRGKNPAIPDDKSILFRAARGKHEIIVALASNNGHAWGIYLRFERLDVSTKALEKGEHAVLPEPV